MKLTLDNILPYLVPMNHRYNKYVDKFINDLLDRQPAITSIDRYYATFRIRNNYITVWIAGKWYAYASRASDTTKSKGEAPMILGTELWDDSRPRRRTLVRLDRYIKDNGKAHADQLSGVALSKVLGEDYNDRQLTSK